MDIPEHDNTVEVMSDSDCTESTNESNGNTSTSVSVRSEYSNQSVTVAFEPARILKQNLYLPKGLCENQRIFDEFFSIETWNSLPAEMHEHLRQFLPDFGSDNDIEHPESVRMLYENDLHRFGVTPLEQFQQNLLEGNYRPEIVKLNASMQKSQRREQRFQECERIGRIARTLALSRERLLSSAYQSAPGQSFRARTERKKRTNQPAPVIPLMGAAQRAKKRYFHEISMAVSHCGILDSLSDDENYPEGPPAQLTKKQKQQLTCLQGGACSPGSEPQIFSTMSSRDVKLDHLLGAGSLLPFGDDFYRQSVVDHRRRRVDEPDHPDLNTTDIRLCDIENRTQISLSQRRLYHKQAIATAKKLQLQQQQQPNRIIKSDRKNSDQFADSIDSPPKTETLRIHTTEPPPILFDKHRDQSGLLMEQTYGKREAVSSDYDEEDDIEGLIPANSVIKSESSFIKSETVSAVKQELEPNRSGSRSGSGQSVLLKNHRTDRLIVPAVQQPIVTIKDEVVKREPEPEPIVTLSHFSGPIKAATLSDLEGIDMMHLPVDLDDSDIGMDIGEPTNRTVSKLTTSGDKLKFDPELMQQTHASFLSLIREIFCSTPNHRTTLENLQDKIELWSASPIAALNYWYHLSDNWLHWLPSAINFLAGEFPDQPEDFVPYLEFKTHLQIYQYIGAGRDSDQRLKCLCDYWMSRRSDMGQQQLLQHQQQQHQQQIDTVQVENGQQSNRLGQIDFEEQIDECERVASPPPARFPTDWTVRPATTEEIDEFRIQERQRFHNPHLSFTYRQHGFESVVGPVKGIYTQIPALAKARGHNMLTGDRPKFVTILTLVRDATARLPNGEGTRAEICELLKSSQYISIDAADNILQTIVSGALDRMHTEHDPCVRYDTKRKIWIYLHRDRTEEEFERKHQQFQGLSKHKKLSNRKMNRKKSTSKEPVVKSFGKSLLIPQAVDVVTKPTVVTQPSLLQPIKNQSPVNHSPTLRLPALSSIQSPGVMLHSPFQKIPTTVPGLTPTGKSGSIKPALVPIRSDPTVDNQSIEPPIEPVLLKSHPPAMPALTIVDSKSKFIGKPKVGPSTTAIKVSTPSGIQTVHVSTAPTIKPQSVLINQSSQQRSLSPAVQKKIIGGRPPPLVATQTHPTTGHSYIIPINIANQQQLSKVIGTTSGPKLIKSIGPAGKVTTSSSSLLQPQTSHQTKQNIVRTVSAGKSLLSPVVAAANLSIQQQLSQQPNEPSTGQKLIPIGSTIQKVNLTGTGKMTGTTTQLTQAQQRQILQTIISQQKQQRVVVSSVANSSVNVSTVAQPKTVIVSQSPQKIVTNTTSTSTIVSQSGPPTLIQPQIIQIHQPTGNKVQITGNLTNQQQNNMLQTLKQQQVRVHSPQTVPQSLMIKQQQVLQQIQKQLQQTKPAASNTGGTAGINQSLPTVQQVHGPVQQIQQQPTMTRIIKQGPNIIQTQQIVQTGQQSTGIRSHSGPIMAKVLTNQSGQIISLENILQKQGIGGGTTTFRVAGPKTNQTNLIQLTPTSGSSQLTQYAVVSQGGIISLGQPTSKLITTQPITVTSATQSTDPKTVPPTPKLLQTNQVQQLVQTKVFGMQAVPNNIQRVKPNPVAGGGGIRMVNTSNINIAQIGGKSVIIATKPGQQATTPQKIQRFGQPTGIGQQVRPNIVWQQAGTSTGTPATNSNTNYVIQGGPTVKVQGTPTKSVMFGNQIVKLQSGPVMVTPTSQSNVNITGVQTVSTSGTVTGSRTVVIGSTGQAIKVHPSTIHPITGGIVQRQQQSQSVASGSSTTQRVQLTAPQTQQVVLGPVLKQSGHKPMATGTSSSGGQQQRLVLTMQGGSQILLQPGFQGNAINLKSLQGLKMIPVQATNKINSTDDRQLFAQIISQSSVPQTQQQQQQQQRISNPVAGTQVPNSSIIVSTSAASTVVKNMSTSSGDS